MSQVREFEGHEIMIVDVTHTELQKYDEWLVETTWSGNMGYTCWPSDAPGCVMLVISSGFGGLWFNQILPALKEYWGEDRIIHEVEFVEDTEAPAGPVGKGKYRIAPAPHLFERWRGLGPTFAMLGSILQNSGVTVTEKELDEWNEQVKAFRDTFQDLYNETFQHITRKR